MILLIMDNYAIIVKWNSFDFISFVRLFVQKPKRMSWDELKSAHFDCMRILFENGRPKNKTNEKIFNKKKYNKNKGNKVLHRYVCFRCMCVSEWVSEMVLRTKGENGYGKFDIVQWNLQKNSLPLLADQIYEP